MIQEGLEEIIGRPGWFSAILSLSKSLGTLEYPKVGDSLGRMPYADISSRSMKDWKRCMVLAAGGNRAAGRAGRIIILLLRQFGGAMAVTDLNFRLLPVPVRLKSGLDALAVRNDENWR